MIKIDLLPLVFTDTINMMGKVYSNQHHIEKSLLWLNRAQDKGFRGGVSSWYGVFSGWGDPYIETTGYIISTYLESYHYFKDKSYLKRAIKMADFLLSVQLPSGGFKTYLTKNGDTGYPTIFNTGQDLIGMVDIYNETRKKTYLESVVKTADFLSNSIDKNGRWVKHSYDAKGHAYDSRVGYALLKASFLTGSKLHKQMAIKNLNWVIKQQLSNGWFLNAELPPPNPSDPYTHTIAYTIEGLLFSGLLLKNKRMINSAKKAADMVLSYYNKHKFIPGTFDKNWQSRDRYTCLTGDAQISVVWGVLYSYTKDKKYLQAVSNINNFLKRLNRVDSKNKNIRGSLAGSFPIYGDLLRNEGYCRMSLINWAVKFYIDALLVEQLNKNETTIKYIGK